MREGFTCEQVNKVIKETKMKMEESRLAEKLSEQLKQIEIKAKNGTKEEEEDEGWEDIDDENEVKIAKKDSVVHVAKTVELN